MQLHAVEDPAEPGTEIHPVLSAIAVVQWCGWTLLLVPIALGWLIGIICWAIGYGFRQGLDLSQNNLPEDPAPPGDELD